jgi:hypothetical protein
LKVTKKGVANAPRLFADATSLIFAQFDILLKNDLAIIFFVKKFFLGTLIYIEHLHFENRPPKKNRTQKFLEGIFFSENVSI